MMKHLQSTSDQARVYLYEAAESGRSIFAPDSSKWKLYLYLFVRDRRQAGIGLNRWIRLVHESAGSLMRSWLPIEIVACLEGDIRFIRGTAACRSCEIKTLAGTMVCRKSDRFLTAGSVT